MAVLDSYTLPLPSGAQGGGVLTIVDTYTCGYNEDYINDPIISGSGNYKLNYGGTIQNHTVECTDYTEMSTHIRRAMYVGVATYPGQAVEWPALTSNNLSESITFRIYVDGGFSTNSVVFYAPASSYNLIDECIVTFSTNIPMFSTQQDAADYLNAQTDPDRRTALMKAINFKSEDSIDETEFVYETIARNYTMDEFGNLTENESEGEIYRGFKIKSKFRTSLYKIAGISDGALKLGIKYHDAVACYYSTDYGNTWQMIPGQPTSLPFNFTYRPYEATDGTGTFWAATGDGSNRNLFIFDNEEDADEYNSGASDGRKASNYGEIMNGDFNNLTGDENDETEFGEVYTRGFFSQQYIMSSGTLQALANDLFDTTTGGIWEDIKKGLDMYGANPMDAVMGLSFFPLELTSIYSTSSASHVWFGGYGWEATGGTCNRIIAPNGYKTLGSLTIQRTFRNWRDYAPYTRLYVSLPYCGVYELDLNRYYDKTVEVRYFFDTRTNGCIACLIAGGHLMDYYNGQCGVTMPITLTDFSSYANSQIQTLLGFGGQAASTGINAASSAGQLAAAGTGAAALGIAGVGVAGAAIGAKAVYGLSQNNINKFNVTKGGSSSMINEYLPQYVEFTFEIQEDCAPDNYGELYGYPSMKSGSVGSFSGFLKCQSVKLNCANATEAERNEIKQLLMSGIYI